MNICVISDFFPPYRTGGAENIALNLTKKFIDKGNRVVVITTNAEIQSNHIHKLAFENIEVYQIGFRPIEKVSPFLGVYNPFILKTLKGFLLENKFEIAHLHNIHNCFSFGIISLLRKFGVRIFFTAHDSYILYSGKYSQGVHEKSMQSLPSVDFRINSLQSFKKNWKRFNPFKSIYVNLQLKKVEKIVCVSRELETFLNSNEIHKTITINNGIESVPKTFEDDINNFRNKLKLTPNDSIVLFIGRISGEKGIDIIIKLAKTLEQKRPDIKFLVIGKEIDDLKLSNVINFGWLEQDEINIAYSSAKATLVPSMYLDPFPTVILESMRASTPVIISSYSGGKEAIDSNINGFVVNPFDTDLIRKLIIRIVDDKYLHKTLGKSALKKFNDCFTIELCSDKYLNLFHESN